MPTTVTSATPQRSSSRLFCALAVLLLLPGWCLATDVQLFSVAPGRSATLAIGGGAPINLRVGEAIDDVKLLSVGRDHVVVSAAGATKTVALQTDATMIRGAVGDTLILTPDAHGQYVADGVVNGRALRFLVDTGAAVTALSRADAERIGLAYRKGTPVQTNTANGVANAWRVSIASLRIGKISSRDVQAIVIDSDALGVGLLGMSYLSGFDIQHQGSTLVLRRRR